VRIVISVAMALSVQAAVHAEEPSVRGAPPEVLASQTCQEHFVQRALPAYPKKAMQARLSGYVVATYDLDGSGKAQGIQIIESQPTSAFDAAALEALQRSEFKPGSQATGCRYVVDFAMVRRR
jgi:TonB family protein